MRPIKLFLLILMFCNSVKSQTNPVISKWLRNTTQTGKYYVTGNIAALSNGILVNCQEVSYSSSFAYIKTTGIPSYPTGPFQDGNTFTATNQNAIFKFPLNPVKNTGTLTATTGGNIGVFINGVALFDYRDGAAWNNSTMSLCGGPGNPTCPGGPATVQAWNRDAIPAEKKGFDCSKGHPANGNYHHHQNPSAFKLDLNVISTICNLYDADGLYMIDSTRHAPLIGFAYDGFPIYGAYGYYNTNGTGAITRMKSSYRLRNITTRVNGPSISTTYPLGYFREDYEYVAHTEPDYLDIHNGRICVTPEYPNPIYCYFATVDSNWNSAYPYVIGPTFYGVYANRKVASITEPVTIYSGELLPVNLLNFTGKVDKGSLLIQWETAAESNSSHFIIERSLDGIQFENIGRVAAMNHSAQQIKYDFTDHHVPTGRIYYRLKQVDTDENQKYSKIITIKNQGGIFDFKVLPNPATDLIAIQYKGLLEYNTKVALYDLQGRQLMNTIINKGQTVAYFNIETLYSGSYVIRLENEELTESQMIQVNK